MTKFECPSDETDSIENHFECSTVIDGAAAIDARMDWKLVPAKAAVYLITGPDSATGNVDHPFLLATVGNLRAALRRRLADDPPELITRRIQYGKVCRRVRWRIVHSPFSANFHYWSAARELFPESYKTMIGWRNAWWLALDNPSRDREGATGTASELPPGRSLTVAAQNFPDLRRVQDLSDPRFRYAGPIRDKSSAGKLIETLQDLFDLCRHHAILAQAPHGKACAYKEMGKCPAPCDGSVAMAWYHGQINRAFEFAAGVGDARAAWREETEAAMKSAAASLRFEQAAKIKQRLVRAVFLGSDPFRYLSTLDDFTWLVLQPGQGKPYIESWLIHPWRAVPIERLSQFKKKDIAAEAESLFAYCQSLPPTGAALTAVVSEQLSLVAHHLFKGDNDPGLYLRLREIGSPADIVSAANKFFARKSPVRSVQEQSSDTCTATD